MQGGISPAHPYCPSLTTTSLVLPTPWPRLGQSPSAFAFKGLLPHHLGVELLHCLNRLVAAEACRLGFPIMLCSVPLHIIRTDLLNLQNDFVYHAALLISQPTCTVLSLLCLQETHFHTILYFLIDCYQCLLPCSSSIVKGMALHAKTLHSKQIT